MDSPQDARSTRNKQVLTEAGPVAIAVPWDRDCTFTPQTVKNASVAYRSWMTS